LVYAKANVYTNEWEIAGLPPPLVDGYQYKANDVLVRTQMASGAWRQRRTWTDGYRTVSVTFSITLPRLSVVEDFVDSKGANWFTMGLVTGNNSTAVRSTYVVRITEDISVDEVDGVRAKVSLPIEIAYRLAP
jgi:hypothetical protein